MVSESTPPEAFPENANAPSGSFDEFELTDIIKLGLKDLGYLSPLPVQRAVFKLVRDGKDIMVQSNG
jgi:superfamily II DNA/RNA helicase